MVGRRVSRFRILELLGRGGMASVWKARDELLGRLVAVKLLSDALAAVPRARRRFRREAEITAQLDHPAIVPIYEAGESDDLAYLVMKLVEGETLAARLARRLLPRDEALRVAEAAADALAFAHARAVIHRDVTPRNIMITPGGEVVVLDFGLARVIGRGDTSTGTVLGTPAYVAPETIRGEGADARSDVYSLGVVLYEALTGAAPFQGERIETIYYECLNRRVDPPSRLRPELTAEIDELVMRMMARVPAERPASAGEVMEALRALRAAAPAPGGSAAAHGPPPPVHEPVHPSQADTLDMRPPGGLGRRLAAGHAHAYLAVLPVEVENGSGGDDHRALVEGLLTAARAGLAHLDRVHIVAEAPAPGSAEDPRAFARRVGANLILHATARFRGTAARLTFAVSDPERGVQVTGGSVDGSSLLPFDLEDRFVAAVREAVGGASAASDPVDRARPRDPAAEERFAEALSYLRRSDHEPSVDGAISLFEGLLATEDETAALQAALARAFLCKYSLTRQRSWEARAERACDRAVRLDSRSPDVMLAMGELHTAAGRYREALDELDGALGARPDLYEALLARARALDGAGRAAEAEESSRRAILLRPQDWRGYHVLGVLLCRHGRYAESLEPWRREATLAPDNAAAYRNLGSALFHLDRFDEALVELRRANDVRPHAVGFDNLGAVLFSLGRYDESVAAFEKAVGLNPADARSWGNLGDACRWAPGREKRMREALERAVGLMHERLDREPAEGEERVRLAGWLSNLGRREEAERTLREALAMAPDDVHCMVGAARTFLSLGRKDEALAWLERAVRSGYGVQRLRRSPELRALEGDPEFERILGPGSRDPRSGQ